MNVPDHAAIHDANDAAFHHDEIARMRIGMIETIGENHVQPQRRPASCKFIAIFAKPIQSVLITQCGAF